MSQLETTFAERKAVASIDSKYCINCGKCRRICPAEAVQEYQRPICRLCPDCGEGPEMSPSEVRAFATKHTCSIGCPLGTVPEGYINLIREGRPQDAYDLIAELNPLPTTCASICSHPCEDECKRGLLMNLGKPINIRGLKRYAVEHSVHKREKFRIRFDKSVGIIGAGPAGITAAFDLAKKGYKVTIYEQGSKPGGMARTCIPEFRLNKQALLEEFAALEEAGIEIIYNVRVGKNPSIDDLLAKHSAVLIAVGSSKGTKLPLEGDQFNPDRVYDAVTFMQRINSNAPRRVGEELAYKKLVDVNVGKKAIVIGAGPVATDTARTLKRLGVPEVTCACIEDEASIPAPADELAEAREEGIEFVTSAAPVRMISDFSALKGIEFKKVESCSRNEAGSFVINTVEGSEFTIDCDTLIFATGQRADVKQLAENAGLELLPNGRFRCDEKTNMTSREGVFVAGGVLVARSSVVGSMASGRKAALAIDNYIQGRELEDRSVMHDLAVAPQSEMIYRIHLEDSVPQDMPKQRFRDTFDQVELGFTDVQAHEESIRCMKCGFSFVDTEKCLGCGACISGCPENCITLKSV